MPARATPWRPRRKVETTATKRNRLRRFRRPIRAWQGRSMLDSVRFRLTLWYTGVLALVLVCLSLGTYWLVRRTTELRTFISLAEISEVFLTTLQAEYKDQLNENSGGDPLRAAAQESIEEFRLR